MIFKKILHGYRGGIKRKRSSHTSFHLDGGFNLILDLPICNPPKTFSSKWMDYPFTEPGWFESNYSQIGHARYIPVCEYYWFYYPIVPTPFRGELGHLRLNFMVEKITEDVSNVDELGDAILSKYNEYYNSSIIGKYLLGYNTEIIESVEEFSACRTTPLNEEEKKELVQFRINKGGFPIINEFEKKTYNNVDWVKIKEIRSEGMKKKYFYATLLNKGFYLLANFTLDTNMSHSGKKWYKDAEASIPRLMEGIKLEFLDDTEKT
ncbi:hypothetical protein MSP8886_01087 [Marinomonas spartinae]|uniref:Uncharacterized protein n=1 Tax=Marinomonas spartinae TaxID=1792290 RepID=A0A1A8T8I4_9GAMM|nr:hypothetical protein [Marinomonas spartinae]SBS28198.1 hypothetical protein MSP8886_01087 [Marinomonas spartinae]